MADYSELKRLAEAAIVSWCKDVETTPADDAFANAADPEVVLEMIARIDLLQRAYSENIVDQVTCKAAGYLMAKAESMTLGNKSRAPGQEIDQLKAEVARLTADNASLRGSCAKLGAEHAGMVRTVRKANTELDRLKKFEDWFVRTDDVGRSLAETFRTERDQAIEKLKGLRKDAERYRWLRQYTVNSLPVSGALASLDREIDGAMGKAAKQ